MVRTAEIQRRLHEIQEEQKRLDPIVVKAKEDSSKLALTRKNKSRAKSNNKKKEATDLTAECGKKKSDFRQLQLNLQNIIAEVKSLKKEERTILRTVYNIISQVQTKKEVVVL